MAMTPEAKVKAKVVKVLKDHAPDVYYFFPATGGYGRSGVPDIVCCVHSRFLGIECKAGKNKPTALQVRELEAIRQANGIAVVVNEDNWDMIPGLLRKIKEGNL
jgi:Holliday junction resolvase